MLRIRPTTAMTMLFAKIPMDLRSVYVNLDSVGMDATVQVINLLRAISVKAVQIMSFFFYRYENQRTLNILVEVAFYDPDYTSLFFIP